jgi:anti-sigma regulatory factor (Ser/Thr protein kinase)
MHRWSHAVTSPGDKRVTDHPPSHEVTTVDRWFTADDLYRVRAEVAAHASQMGASEAQVERLLIVASELATNAVRHGGGGGRLQLWLAHDRLFCRVSDEGPGIPDPQRGHERPAPTAIGGRGLWLCRQFSDSLDIARTGGRTVITTMIELDRGKPA